MKDTPITSARLAWQQMLPPLVGATVTLREPTAADAGALLEVLATAETADFGADAPHDPGAIANLIAQRTADRQSGRGFLYIVALTRGGRVVGLFHVRALDPQFETAEWVATLVPAVRGTGVFLEAAHLVGRFVFATIAANRLEARVLLENGRANGALRKLGAAQEGVLRRSLRRQGVYFDQVLWSLLRGDLPVATRSTGPWLH